MSGSDSISDTKPAACPSWYDRFPKKPLKDCSILEIEVHSQRKRLTKPPQATKPLQDCSAEELELYLKKRKVEAEPSKKSCHLPMLKGEIFCNMTLPFLVPDVQNQFVKHKKLTSISELFQLPRFFCSIHGSRLEDPAKIARLAKLVDIRRESNIRNSPHTNGNFEGKFHNSLHIDYRPPNVEACESFRTLLADELSLRMIEYDLEAVMTSDLEGCRAKLKEMLEEEEAQWEARFEITEYKPPQVEDTPKDNLKIPAAKGKRKKTPKEKWETRHPSLHPSSCLTCFRHSKGLQYCNTCFFWREWSGYFTCVGCKGRYCGDLCCIGHSCSTCQKMVGDCCYRKCMICETIFCSECIEEHKCGSKKRRGKRKR